MKNWIKNYWAVFIPLTVLLFIVFYLLVLRNKATDDKVYVLGMVDAETVDVSSSMPGRIIKLMVNEGDIVKSGQVVAELQTSEIEQVKDQALQAVNLAQNNLALLNKGISPEVLNSARNLQQIAQDQVTLLMKTNQRFQDLYSQGVVSGQEKDLVEFKYKVAQKELENTKLNVQLLQNGASKEMISNAEILKKQAESAASLMRNIEDNAQLKAPVDGVIVTMISKQGEMINAGYPLMTVQKANSYSISFNIRQNQMKGIKKGMVMSVSIPGTTPSAIKAIVTDFAPALGYADWVPENQSGQFQLKTFKIKLVPINMKSIEGLRSGMSAQLAIP